MRGLCFRLLSMGVLGGCATLPTGPSVLVLPAPGKSFEQFQAEEAICRQWAAQQIAGVTPAAAWQNTDAGALTGTALGAAVGAALGAASGDAGAGAAIGAGAGLLFGAAIGADADQANGRNSQGRYDSAYQQCMYAKGNQLPGIVQRSWRPSGSGRYPPPPPGYLSAGPPMPPGPPVGLGWIPDPPGRPPPPLP